MSLWLAMEGSGAPTGDVWWTMDGHLFVCPSNRCTPGRRRSMPPPEAALSLAQKKWLPTSTTSWIQRPTDLLVVWKCSKNASLWTPFLATLSLQQWGRWPMVLALRIKIHNLFITVYSLRRTSGLPRNIWLLLIAYHQRCSNIRHEKNRQANPFGYMQEAQRYSLMLRQINRTNWLGQERTPREAWEHSQVVLASC